MPQSRQLSDRKITATVGALLVITTLLGASCPPDRKAYTTISSITTAVQAAVKIAAFESQTNANLASHRAEIQAAYEKYQKAALLAADLSEQLSNDTAIVDIIKNEAQLLIDLINAFLPDGKKVKGVK